MSGDKEKRMKGGDGRDKDRMEMVEEEIIMMCEGKV